MALFIFQQSCLQTALGGVAWRPSVLSTAEYEMPNVFCSCVSTPGAFFYVYRERT